MPTLAEDMEWQALLKSGRLRQEFDRLRQQIRNLTKERDDARQEAVQARSQARFGPTPAVNAPAPAPIDRDQRRTQARLEEVERNPASATPAPRVVGPAPVITMTTEPEEKKLEDDSAQRFSLLELD